MAPARSFRRLIARLRRDARGAMLIETALVTPVLLLMSFGAFESSQMFAREAELQTAAAEASAIALASSPDTATKRATLQGIIVSSTGLTSANVSVTAAYRCGSNAAYVQNAASCGSTTVSNFVKIYMTDVYTPMWAGFGIGGSITFRVTRYVMLGQT